MFVTKQLFDQIDDAMTFTKPYLNWLEEYANKEQQIRDDFSSQLAAARALHVATECLVDTANLVIDALVMRDPGGYLDIVKVLREEGAVTESWFQAFEGCLELRSRLVHKYRDLGVDELAKAVKSYGPLFREYYQQITTYLKEN